MKSDKLIIGVAVGVVVALLAIPKTRKILSGALCAATDSLKSMMTKADDAASDVNDYKMHVGN